MKAGFIGGGNMAQAIAAGLLARGARAADLAAIEPVEATRAFWITRGMPVFAAFDASLLDAEVLVLAVKPQSMAAALAPMRARLRDQVVLSIAAGVRIADMARQLGSADAPSAPYATIVRAMPNTPALVGAGISGLYAPPGVDAASRNKAESLLKAVGKTAWFDDETMLDAVTAVSGSGPAYVFYFIEALEQAARDLGMDAPTARLFATETFSGGAKLAVQSEDSAATLRAKVTSKRGTTERAIESFDAAHLKQRFIEGVAAACGRAKELGDELASPSGERAP
ncbi:MAG: pyrroline-5-carboxylate reductase [Betaproteobacteria bacterium]|nr:pyrroline-5-carboxylate reductase [Betaproteobacteria bacterium]